MRKTTERGTLWDFSIFTLSQNPKKLKKGTLWDFFFKKKSQHFEKEDPLVSPNIVCYAEKKAEYFLAEFLGPTSTI